MSESWNEKSVFITGGSGFVGAHLAKELLKRGASVTTLVRDLKRVSYLDLLDIKHDVNIVLGDICNLNTLHRIIVGYDITHICHLAAQSIVQKAVEHPLSTYSTNIIGTVSVLEAVRTGGRDIECILVTSTDKVYGDTMNATEDSPLKGIGIYETSKSAADLIAQAYSHIFQLPIIVTRACNIIGFDPLNRRIVPNTIKAILSGEQPVIFKDERTLREYIHVNDVIDAYIKLMEHVDITKGKVYNICSGSVLSQEQIVRKIAQIASDILGKSIEPVYITRKPVIKEIEKQSLNCERIYRDIGWKASIDIDKALKLTFMEFLKNASILSGNV